MKQDLLIIGAGSVGKFIAYNINQFQSEYTVIGFLDDDPTKQKTKIAGYNVLGTIDDLINYRGKKIAIVFGISFPQMKMKIVEKYLTFEFDFPNLVSKFSWISEGVQLGKGSIIYPGVSINYNTQVGNFVVINMNCAIGHDAEIGDFVAMAPGVNLGGFTCIGENTEMGIGSATKQFIKIGKNCVIGGQAIVIKDVGSNVIVKGVPAR